MKEGFNLFKRCSLDLWNRFLNAYKLYYKANGTMLAASTSFYFLLTIIPMTILLIRVVGFFLGGLTITNEKLFVLGSKLLPGIDPSLVNGIKSTIDGLLYGSGGYNIFHFGALIWSSLLFLNSIWQGFYRITGDTEYRSLKRHLKGLVIIVSTIVLFNITLGMPMAVSLAVSIVKNNFIIDFISENFPTFYLSVKDITSIEWIAGILIKSNIFHAIIFVLYFTFLYRWFWGKKISIKIASIGAFVFVFTFFIGKSFFYFYVFYLKDNFIENYGDYYTFLVALIWIFFVISFFFYGACICKIFGEQPLGWFNKDIKKVEG